MRKVLSKIRQRYEGVANDRTNFDFLVYEMKIPLNEVSLFKRGLKQLLLIFHFRNLNIDFEKPWWWISTLSCLIQTGLISICFIHPFWEANVIEKTFSIINYIHQQLLHRKKKYLVEEDDRDWHQWTNRKYLVHYEKDHHDYQRKKSFFRQEEDEQEINNSL